MDLQEIGYEGVELTLWVQDIQCNEPLAFMKGGDFLD
jgi:hypothetical protein